MTTINQRNRGLPFLHRNWLKATNHWSKMGNKVSSLARDSSDIAIAVDRDDNPGQGRVPKRRRLENQYDGFPLYEDYGKAQRALRIEVLKVSHKDAPRVKNGITNGLVPPNVRDVTQVKARCKLSICGHQNGQMVILHVDSQVCDIRIFKNPAGSAPMARFYSIKPFHIPEEKIYVERDDDASFGLASCYTVLIELESAGDQNWPPRELVPVSDDDSYYGRGCLPPRKWLLTASIGDVFNARNRKTMRMRVRKNLEQDFGTNFLMDVDVRWLTAVSSQLVMREHTKDVMPSIVVHDENAPPKTAVNGNIPGAVPLISTLNGGFGHRSEPLVNGEVEKLVNGHVNGSIPEIPDDLAEGETTPGRSRRTRQDVNYNVKQMMNIALGKETRKRRKFGEEQTQLDEHTITYLLPPEQVQTERFACLLCGAENERLSQLRAHYSVHPQYEFNFEFNPKRGVCVTVKPSLNGIGAPLRPVVYQLGLPVQPLDMDKFVNGDDSWLSSRLGPEDGMELTLSSQPARPQPKSTRKGTKKKVLVPVSKQQLFDPYSKVPLAPGDEVPEHPIDDGWLLLKHRENLQDFIDLTSGEKDYLQEWDAFILRKHISSEQYLPRNLLRFVHEKSMWLVAKKTRAEEFSKHISTLMARRVLPDATIMEVTQVLNDARAKMKSNPAAAAAAAEPTQPAKKKTSGGCCTICLEPVPVPSMLLCANKSCKSRLYHDHCVKNPEEAVAMGDEWKCTDCA